ncbi:SdpI family protein [Bythopirellula polymerisocia]|uniref:SdpI/YhfL protein family protein n=1 Tax=Bythopirellula polymerisocia TaxID=2528003 RepID=A0A5C6CKV9_9BACT|nr:SdpI family protein [Bythopirellula polymerisocia]TWU24695.1 hypothetical protein Pla144_35810 [Bythopirellula polymerisocia]
MFQVDPPTAILFVYLIAGGLLVVLGLPLYFGKVPPNRLYGFRTRSTLVNPQKWMAVNRVAGGWMVLVGTAVAGVATWVARLGYSVSQAALIDLAVFAVGMMLILVHSTLVLWRN